MKQRSFVVPLAILALTLTACAGGATNSKDEAVSAGPDQTIGVAALEPAFLDVQKGFDNSSRAFFGRVYDGLYEIGDDGVVIPRLAASMPKNVGVNTYEIKLKTGVKFSDGTPFNADSAVFSVNRAVSPAVATSNGELKRIAGATKIDDSTIQVTTTAPSPQLANAMVNALKMLSPKLTDITKVDQMIGTGPYKVVSLDHGVGGVLAYNDQYWGAKPQVTKVTFKFIQDPGTRMQALLAGEVDVVPSITPTDAKLLGTKDHVAVSALNEGSYFARLNALAGALTDVRVRQAVNYAVDREGIVKTIFNGYASPSQCTLLPMGTVGTSTNIKSPYTYDPTKAKALLKEAGAEGTTLTFASSNGSYAEDRNINQLIAQQLEAVGFKVQLTVADSTAAFIGYLQKGGAAAPSITAFGHSNNLASINRVFDTWVLSGLAGYKNEVANATIKQAQATEDQKAAQPLYDKAQQSICDDAGYLYLFDFKALHGLSNRLVWTPTPESVSNNILWDKIKVIKTS